MKIRYNHRLKMINIQYGTSCLQSFCPHHHECKRVEKFWWHNFCVKFDAFWSRIGIPLHMPFSRIYNNYANLSGTPLCPYKLERQYDCHGCACGYGAGRRCYNIQREHDIHNNCLKRPVDGQYCAYLIALPWDHKTGKILYGDDS